MAKTKVLITGCGRSGTGYMAKLMQAIGMDVGHEKEGKNGTSDWHGVGWNWPTLAEYDLILHVVRNPLKVFQSLRGIKQNSWDYIGEFLPEIYDVPKKLEKCMLYWLHWNQWAEKVCSPNKYGFPLRVEHVNDWYPVLVDYLPHLRGCTPTQLQLQTESVATDTNTRKPKNGYDEITWEMLETP